MFSALLVVGCNLQRENKCIANFDNCEKKYVTIADKNFVTIASEIFICIADKTTYMCNCDQFDALHIVCMHTMTVARLIAFFVSHFSSQSPLKILYDLGY